eukprot:1094078-Pleurochrysis_carterae.AAC.1
MHASMPVIKSKSTAPYVVEIQSSRFESYQLRETACANSKHAPVDLSMSGGRPKKLLENQTS